MRPSTRQRVRLSSGTELSFITAGEVSRPAVLLLHGFPGSASYFREVIPALSRVAHIIAPDLPGFGESDVLSEVSFAAFGLAVSELLERLSAFDRGLPAKISGPQLNAKSGEIAIEELHIAHEGLRLAT